MRITLQTLLTLVVAALVAVAKRSSFHPPQDAALEDPWLMKPFDDDGDFVPGDSVVEVVDNDATDLFAVLEEDEDEDEDEYEDEDYDYDEDYDNEEEEEEEEAEPRTKQKGLLTPRACNKTSTGMAQNCAVAPGEMLPCGTTGITSDACKRMGCCVHSTTSICHYPMDECTVDKHFVFAIRSTSGSINLNLLAIPGQPNCIPIIVSPMVAIYKFNLTECGVRSYEVANTMIHMVEVHTLVQVLSLKYGVISRSDSIRFMIECRYIKPGSDGLALATVGFQVKSPVTSFPSILIGQGLYGVELKIAKNRNYSSYYDESSLPVGVMLGAPVYLELNLISIRRTFGVLVVNYCLAFPRDASNALVLIYEGCPNPNDITVSVMSVRGDPANTWQKRFVVHAFQFMNVSTSTYRDEQIFFMCSTSVCIEYPCNQGCFSLAPPN